MYNKLFGFLTKILCLVIGTAMLSSCDTNSIGNTGSQVAPLDTAKLKQTANVSGVGSAPMNVAWSIDGMQYSDATIDLRDTSRHLLTLTVVKVGEGIESPIRVNGLQYIFSPVPTDNRGESVLIQDINCNTADFMKVGDTCSAYMQIVYNQATGESNPPFMHVLFATNAYPTLSAIFAINDLPMYYNPTGTYRLILPAETDYYVGSAVVSSPSQYEMILMQNVATPPLTINKITSLTNPIFSLMNRTTAESNDPYYGQHQQCSLTANLSIGQKNQLESRDSECILVYKAAPTGTKSTESDTVEVETDAILTYPRPLGLNVYNLTANYVTGVPIPEYDINGSSFQVISGTTQANGDGSMYMATDGVLSSGEVMPSNNSFNAVNISYNFAPIWLVSGYSSLAAPYGIAFYQNGVINIANQENNDYTLRLVSGDQIITDGSSTNPVTVGKITQLVPASSSGESHVDVNACGGAGAWATASITSSVDLTHKGMVHLYMQGAGNGACGSWSTNTLNNDIPLTGYSQTVYSRDDQGCGGNQWDMGANVWIDTGLCNGDDCSYTLHVHASHGGGSGQCHDSQDRSVLLKFKRPQIYMQLSDLTNFTYNGELYPTYIAKSNSAGTINAYIGDQGGLVTQNIICENGRDYCSSQSYYSNGLTSNNMYYTISLKAGALFYGSVLNFNRSDYDISGFTMSYVYW